jgi:hypothetical protein
MPSDRGVGNFWEQGGFRTLNELFVINNSKEGRR